MSDKFFFKGRQDARQSHIQYGFETKTIKKLGTKKHPLNLMVTSKVRQEEVQNLVNEAQLYANVLINNNEDAIESIEELTAILDKPLPTTFDKQPGRNDTCICGSGKKYKKCCA